MWMEFFVKIRVLNECGRRQILAPGIKMERYLDLRRRATYISVVLVELQILKVLIIPEEKGVSHDER